MGGFGAALVSASPSWPSMDAVEGSGGGDQVCQQTSDLAERERNETLLLESGTPFLACAAVTAR